MSVYRSGGGVSALFGRVGVALALVSAVIGLAGFWTATAAAQLIWTNPVTSSIAQSDLDGGGLDPSFISLPSGTGPFGITLAGSFLYWANNDADSIGRANLDGSGVDVSYLGLPAGTAPVDVAVGGGFVYWSSNKTDRIGRANLDGSDLDPSFITLAPGDEPTFLTIAGPFLYWANFNGASHISVDSIGRATLDGSSVDPTFITLPPLTETAGIAIRGSFLYWAANGAAAIGRARLDGSGVDPGFISLPSGSSPAGIAINDPFLYWADIGTNAIGRAGLDGTGVEPGFIQLAGAGVPVGIVALNDAAGPTGGTPACDPLLAACEVAAPQPPASTPTAPHTTDPGGGFATGRAQLPDLSATLIAHWDRQVEATLRLRISRPERVDHSFTVRLLIPALGKTATFTVDPRGRRLITVEMRIRATRRVIGDRVVASIDSGKSIRESREANNRAVATVE